MSTSWILVDELVTGGTGTLLDPYTGWNSELLDRLVDIGVGAGINGTTVIFGVGAYDTEGGLVFDDQYVHLLGLGGPGSLGSTDTASTFLVSSSDAPSSHL